MTPSISRTPLDRAQKPFRKLTVVLLGVIAGAFLAVAAHFARVEVRAAYYSGRVDRIHRGQTIDEVVAILGRPDAVKAFPRGDGQWYTYYSNPLDRYARRWTLSFDHAGRVIGVHRARGAC